MNIFISQFVMGLKLYLRRPSALFWMTAFPVLMLLGLGTVFSGKADQGIKLVWSQPDARLNGEHEAERNAALQVALQELHIKVEIISPAQAELRWKSGKLPVLLETINHGYHLRVNSYLAAQGMPVVAVVQQGFLIMEARAAGAHELERIPLQMESPGGHHGGPYAAFLLPGLLGLNLLMMGVFVVCMVDVQLRVEGIYKRLATTPLPRYIYLSAQMLVRLIIVLVSAVVLIAAGALFFDIHNQGSYVDMFVLIFLGTACFSSMGYLLASFASTIETSNGLANLVFMPLMMLSGVYFSLDAAPAWLQKTADLLPLTPLLKAMRSVFNDGATLASQSTSIWIVSVWAAVLFVGATRRFKWV